MGRVATQTQPELIIVTGSYPKTHPELIIVIGSYPKTPLSLDIVIGNPLIPKLLFDLDNYN